MGNKIYERAKRNSQGLIQRLGCSPKTVATISFGFAAFLGYHTLDSMKDITIQAYQFPDAVKVPAIREQYQEEQETVDDLTSKVYMYLNLEKQNKSDTINQKYYADKVFHAQDSLFKAERKLQPMIDELSELSTDQPFEYGKFAQNVLYGGLFGFLTYYMALVGKISWNTKKED